jgi:hypothetical protein
MIDLSKTAENRQRQDSIWVSGAEYKIHTPFPFWIAFEKKFGDWRKEGRKGFFYEEFDYLYALGIPEDREIGFEELSKFYRNEQPLPNPTGKTSSVRGVDWLLDSEYIYSAFLQQYGIDLLASDIHWHNFLSLFNGLAGTRLNDIISARYNADKKGPMREMREAWELPEPETERPIFEMV